jgi:hypothetical protein
MFMFVVGVNAGLFWAAFQVLSSAGVTQGPLSWRLCFALAGLWVVGRIFNNMAFNGTYKPAERITG